MITQMKFRIRVKMRDKFAFNYVFQIQDFILE
jgi:hypothetical protein